MTSNENEFRLAIHNALCSCLGLPPSSEQALSLIRQAYTEPENNPQPARTADVIYWSLSPEEAEDPAFWQVSPLLSPQKTPAAQAQLRRTPAALLPHRPDRSAYTVYPLSVHYRMQTV